MGLRYADLAKTTPRIKLRLVSDSNLQPESGFVPQAVTRQEQRARELATQEERAEQNVPSFLLPVIRLTNSSSHKKHLREGWGERSNLRKRWQFTFAKRAVLKRLAWLQAQPLEGQLGPLLASAISLLGVAFPGSSGWAIAGSRCFSSLTVCMHACLLNCFSCVRFFATLWMVVHQAPLSMGFSR